jgi:hypothetical protein
MPLEHRVFLYDACPKYWSYRKFRRGCRRMSFVVPIAGKITVYMWMKRCGAAGSNVDRKTTRSRHVLTDEKLKIVDSAFTANGRVCTISTICNKTAFTYKKRGSGGSCNSRRSLKQDWILWTGRFLWSLMRVQTPHSFYVASWMFGLLIQG